MSVPHTWIAPAEGISFTRAYANCPVCTPSRGTISSGRHAHAGPVQGFWDVFKPAAPSTAHLLRGHGYRTAYFGKWHPGIVRDQIPPAVRDSSEHVERFAESFPRPAPEYMCGGFEDWCAYDTRSPRFDP
jgi:arylsulfatase A-like enzyme